MPATCNEPTYLVLEAQAENIARIATGLVLPGTDGQGTPITLTGPRPDVIRLYDTPMRFFEDAAVANWQRLVTIVPLNDSGTDKIATRNDRSLAYQVQMAVRLTEAEQQEDRPVASSGGLRGSHLLAKKAHNLVYDWHHVFHDHLLLPTVGCPGGLVNDARYRMTWVAGNSVQWPMALVVAEVECDLNAW